MLVSKHSLDPKTDLVDFFISLWLCGGRSWKTKGLFYYQELCCPKEKSEMLYFACKVVLQLMLIRRRKVVEGEGPLDLTCLSHQAKTLKDLLCSQLLAFATESAIETESLQLKLKVAFATLFTNRRLLGSVFL